MEDVTRDSRTGLDEALFSLAPEGLGGVGSAIGRTRLRTYIALRWIAVAGQSAAVLFVALYLGFDLPLATCLGLIAASAWLNVFLSFAFQSQRLTNEGEAGLQLLFDVVQLAALIAATGGLSNPFLLLLIAPVTVASVSLRPAYAAALAIIAFGLAGLMPLVSAALPSAPGSPIELPALFEWGHITALAVGLLFFSLSALRVSEDETRLVRALDAAQVVLAREQRLSALGAMSAMTAHELGTPLATIHLVAKEMARGMPEDSDAFEDAKLIAEQAERCRTILRKLGQAREAEDAVHAQMPLSAIVEEAAAPHRGLGVDIETSAEPAPGAPAKIPTIARSPEVLVHLGAFLENAVSFADTQVRAIATWSDTQIMVTISDDGPGFAPEVLPKLGEPYVSQRSEAQLGGGDMGLGFFIAKTLIERTGGRVATGNRTPPKRGAVVQAVWPRDALAPPELDTSDPLHISAG